MTDGKPVKMLPVNGLMEKPKDLRNEILMEKLRSKTSQHKNLTETAKAVRMALLDKRWAVDSQDRMILQKCLDSFQHCIKVSSMQSLIERLECLSRQLGLKFVVGTTGVALFISSEMFYLEIIVDTAEGVKEIKIHHEGKIETQTCEEMVSSINRGDFPDFSAQLEGLIAVYQLNADKKVKCKAFCALQSLEEDLCRLACDDIRQLQSYMKDPWAQVHKTPVGFLQKRRGGHPMRLTYFVSPYELLDKEKGIQPLTIDLLTKGKPAVSSGLRSLVVPSYTRIGQSATVLLEGSAANKLQLTPIIAQRQGKGNGPVYAQLVPQNSAMLPACFTLKLSHPMPLCAGLAKLIHATTEVEVSGDWANSKPMLGLVAQQAYNKLIPDKNIELNLNKGLFLHLPEQTHCYFLCESRNLSGCVVNSIPFTHPSHVPPLLAALRQQTLFNVLISSCVRPQSKRAVDLESVLMFEVTALSWTQLSVSLEWPPEESLGTLELNLTEPCAPRASLHALHRPRNEHLDEYITRVLNATHSIPVTLRALIKLWEREAATKKMNGNYPTPESNFNCGLGGIDPGGEHNIKQEPGMMHRALYPTNVGHSHQGGTYLSEQQQHQMSMMCQESAESNQNDERKSKKRKSDSDLWPGQKKGKPGMNEIMDSDNESESDGYVNEDDVNMNSDSSNDEAEEQESSVSQNEFTSDLELSGMDANDAMGGQDNRTSSDMDNSNDGEIEDMTRNSFHKAAHKKQRLKSKDSENRSRSTSSLLLDLTEGKSYMPSSVSITPIGTSTSNSANTSGPGGNLPSMLGCLDRRPGIEIIPITSAQPATLPSSITITPISTPQSKSVDDRSKSEKKSSKSSEERSKEKKKKKRRVDSMGPPEKVPSKQDPLTKPVSVTIKPTDGSPIRSNSPNSMLRKFSSSPTPGRSVSITKSPTPSAVKNLSKSSGTSSHQSSPRDSPVQNSPKHLAGYSSPKNHNISSPKHSSSGSGKPSMSTLKSATSGSPGKSSTTGYDLTKKISKDNYSSTSSKEKEKKHSSLTFSSSGRNSPKLKNQLKLKQLEITPIPSDAVTTEPLISPPNVETNKASTPNQNRNRKGSLSAVIDKLKSQHSTTDSDQGGSKGNTATINKFSDPKNSMNNMKSSSDIKNQEYMVKPSSDGMKITINKTRSKESSSSSSSKLNYNSSVPSKQSSPQLTPQSQGSPKTHTGLKPGVISGPASKKSQAMQSNKSVSSSITPVLTSPRTLSPSGSPGTSMSNSLSKMPYNKSSNISNTGMNLTKSNSKQNTGSPKNSATDLSKIIREKERDKVKSKLMNNSEKSLFTSKSERHSSPSGSRDEIDSDRYKSSKEANFLVEGLIKPLDTSKFQIPKLKNQSVPDKNNPISQYDSRSLLNDFTRSYEQNKYQFSQYDSRTGESIQKSYPINVPKPLVTMGSASPKIMSGKDQDRPLEFTKAMSDSMSRVASPHRKDDKDYNHQYSSMPLDFKTDIVKGFSIPKSSEERKGGDSLMKPPTSGSLARGGSITPQEPVDMLLDFSATSGNKVSGMVAVRPVYPNSPALALQLAKSPVPPLVTPSPHSNSPCITDDELIDETLVGPGK